MQINRTAELPVESPVAMTSPDQQREDAQHRNCPQPEGPIVDGPARQTPGLSTPSSLSPPPSAGPDHLVNVNKKSPH